MAKQFNEEDFEFVTLTFEDGIEEEYAILCTFQVDDKRYSRHTYAALCPVDDENMYADALSIFRVERVGGEETLDYLDSQEELDVAVEAVRLQLLAMGIELD